MSVPPLPREDLDHVFTHTRTLWEEARGASVFITGGTGFFGMWLLESLAYLNDSLQLGLRATVLSRNPAAFAAKAPHLAKRRDLTLLAGDVRNFRAPPDLFQFIVHAATATNTGTGEHHHLETLETIIDGTRAVLRFAETCGVRKLLLTSSGAVYGPQPAELERLREDDPGAPDPMIPSSAYGEGKRVAEYLTCVHAAKYGYEAKIARCFAFVGPHLPLNSRFAIGNFLGDGLAGAPIRVAGDGTAIRSYLYAADLASWLWTILFRGLPNRPYNVGSMCALDILETARLVRRTLEVNVPIQLAARSKGTPPNRYVPDTTRAGEELGLQQRLDLSEAVRRTAAWHRLRLGLGTAPLILCDAHP
jgi:dTDP-glucose 4,6-dehydratase